MAGYVFTSQADITVCKCEIVCHSHVGTPEEFLLSFTISGTITRKKNHVDFHLDHTFVT